jgi:putative transposase
VVKNRTLAKAISDVGWGEVVRRLEYKAAWYGRTLVKIGRWYSSSKRCSVCGCIKDALPLEVREWTCAQCGTQHDRDINAAKNVWAVGHTVLAYGETVRPATGSPRAGSSR